MIFFVIAIIAVLIVFVFMKYRKIYSVVAAVMVIFGMTTVVLVWGIRVFSSGSMMQFFNSSIGNRDFYYLMAAWYAFDLLCAVKIIKNHIDYRKVNYKDTSER